MDSCRDKEVTQSSELIRHCKECTKKWTKYCPIRVWGRNEGNNKLHLDVDPEKDYCSRFTDLDRNKQHYV